MAGSGVPSKFKEFHCEGLSAAEPQPKYELSMDDTDGRMPAQ